MEKYDYLESMTNDIIDYIRDNYTDEAIRSELNERIEWEENLNDDLWTEDRITGNASGSYTFSTYKAEEYICHNLDLLAEAMEEFGDDRNALKKGAEWCDVTIRCYLLNQAISNALDTLETEVAE